MKHLVLGTVYVPLSSFNAYQNLNRSIKIFLPLYVLNALPDGSPYGYEVELEECAVYVICSHPSFYDLRLALFTEVQ